MRRGIEIILPASLRKTRCPISPSFFNQAVGSSNIYHALRAALVTIRTSSAFRSKLLDAAASNRAQALVQFLFSAHAMNSAWSRRSERNVVVDLAGPAAIRQRRRAALGGGGAAEA